MYNQERSICDWLDQSRVALSQSSTSDSPFFQYPTCEQSTESHPPKNLYNTISPTHDMDERPAPVTTAQRRSQRSKPSRTDSLSNPRLPRTQRETPPVSNQSPSEALSTLVLSSDDPDTHSNPPSTFDVDAFSGAFSTIESSSELTSISRSQRNDAKSGQGGTQVDETLGKRTRSRSPVKKMVDLSAARPSIRINPGQAPIEVRTILESRFRKIMKGRALMPGSLKREIRENDPGESYYSDEEFDNCSVCTNEERKVLRKIVRIRDNSLECFRKSKPEPSWGSEVFKPLLDLAVKLSNANCSQKVQMEDITTVPVAPEWLPKGVYDSTLQAKRVDFGVYLSQSNEQQEQHMSRLEARRILPDDLCLNHTPIASDYIRWIPQILAIETKISIPNGGMGAEIQLAIWMASLRNRLQRLQKSDDNTSRIQQMLKPMPCLKVSGFEWKMFWCTVGEKGETLLHGPKDLGSTQTILGTYAVLAGLRELIGYGRDEYMPWLMEECYW